jgi:hypothetical protein
MQIKPATQKQVVRKRVHPAALQENSPKLHGAEWPSCPTEAVCLAPNVPVAMTKPTN